MLRDFNLKEIVQTYLIKSVRMILDEPRNANSRNKRKDHSKCTLVRKEGLPKSTKYKEKKGGQHENDE